MSEKLCPACGCVIGEDAYEEEGVVYCCELCAGELACDCGCYVILDEDLYEED